MAKQRVTAVNVVLTLIIISLSLIVGIQALKIKKLESYSISMIPGDSLPVLNLVTQENIPLDNSVFKEGTSVIFCFEVPCAACNPNLNTWRNLSRYFGKEVTAFGIILDDDPSAVDMLRAKKVNFPLYLPGDRQTLKDKMHLQTNMAQTIVVNKNKIMAVKLGNLTAEDLRFLIHTIKKCIGRV